MNKAALLRPNQITVKRSDLRQNQRATLRRAKGTTVVVISAHDKEEEKLLLDRKYFDALVQRLRAVMETLEIATDRKLFAQILSAAESLEQDTRRGKLHSFEEAFGEA